MFQMPQGMSTLRHPTPRLTTYFPINILQKMWRGPFHELDNARKMLTRVSSLRVSGQLRPKLLLLPEPMPNLPISHGLQFLPVGLHYIQT